MGAAAVEANARSGSQPLCRNKRFSGDKKQKSFSKATTTPKSFNDPLRSEEFLKSLTDEGLESMSLFSAARSSNAKRHLFAPDHPSGDDDDDEFANEYPEEDGFVWVDAHVLATPTLADIDHDGRSELVLAVSYFFDADEYATVKVKLLFLDTSRPTNSGDVDAFRSRTWIQPSSRTSSLAASW